MFRNHNFGKCHPFLCQYSFQQADHLSAQVLTPSLFFFPFLQEEEASHVPWFAYGRLELIVERYCTLPCLGSLLYVHGKMAAVQM